MAVYRIQALGGRPNAVAVGLNSSGNTCGDWAPSQFYGETRGLRRVRFHLHWENRATTPRSTITIEGGFYETVGALGVATIPPPPGANRIAAMAINSSGAIAQPVRKMAQSLTSGLS